MTVVTSEEALEWVHSRLKFNIRPGLSRVNALLDLLGRPEKELAMIHVAGTNGKGSTVAFVRSIFMSAGLKKVASFTSPFIESFGERMAINGKPMPDEKLIFYVNLLKPLVDQIDANPELTGITEFEIITAMGFKYFADEQVDLAVIEVGLGGLLDSTNVILPKVCGITTIGLDHIDILGKTLAEIAAQKAGIIKNGVPVVVGIVGPEAMAVITDTATKHQAKQYTFGSQYQIELLENERFNFKNAEHSFDHLEKSLRGLHQIENAATAIELALVYAEQIGFELTEAAIRKGLRSTSWPARMEEIATAPLTLLDGAHNVHAMKRLLENISSELTGKKLTILFSAITTKDIEQMLEMLHSVPDAHVILTTFDHPKALDLADFSDWEEKGLERATDWKQKIREVRKSLEADEVFLITGSLYFSSQVREFFVENFEK